MRRVVPTDGSEELTVTRSPKFVKLAKEFTDFTFLMETMKGDGSCLFHTVIYAEKCLVEGRCLPIIRLQEAMDKQLGVAEQPVFEVTVQQWQDLVGKPKKVADAIEDKPGGKDPNLRVYTWKKASKGVDQFFKQ